MQFAKDSFYMALRNRLAALNPARTVSVDGVTVVALLVSENAVDNSVKPLPEAYYLAWGACRTLAKHDGTSRPLLGMDCTISYWTAGTSDAGVDRGRLLGELDSELIAICHPLSTGKRDFTESPSVDLGTSVLWTPPVLNAVEVGEARDREGASLRAVRRSAVLTVCFFPEVDLS